MISKHYADRGRGRRSIVLGRLLVTTTVNAAGAPLLDHASARDGAGRFWRGTAVYLAFWRRRERPPGLALVLGWRDASPARRWPLRRPRGGKDVPAPAASSSPERDAFRAIREPAP